MKKIFLVLLFVSLVFYVSKNKSDIHFESMEASENSVNDPCTSADCTPRSLSTSYHSVAHQDRKRIDNVLFKNLVDGLFYKKIISENDYKKVNFNDNVNPLILEIGSSILIIGPEENGFGVKTIEYRFDDCNKISDLDKNNVKSILSLIGFDGNHDNFYKFNRNKDEIMVNNYNYKRFSLEVNCDPINNFGQFNIYNK